MPSDRNAPRAKLLKCRLIYKKTSTKQGTPCPQLFHEYHCPTNRGIPKQYPFLQSIPGCKVSEIIGTLSVPWSSVLYIFVICPSLREEIYSVSNLFTCVLYFGAPEIQCSTKPNAVPPPRHGRWTEKEGRQSRACASADCVHRTPLPAHTPTGRNLRRETSIWTAYLHTHVIIWRISCPLRYIYVIRKIAGKQGIHKTVSW